MLTPSAPILRASSTVATRTLLLGSGPNAVEAERWIISPRSRPYPRWPNAAAPLCTMAASAPPEATASAMDLTLFIPLMGPTVTPWSMGIMTAFPVLRLNILSMRIDVPLNLALSFSCMKSYLEYSFWKLMYYLVHYSTFYYNSEHIRCI